MKYAIILITLLVTGCATIYDNADPCQKDIQPNWCGSSNNDVIIIIDKKQYKGKYYRQ